MKTKLYSDWNHETLELARMVMKDISLLEIKIKKLENIVAKLSFMQQQTQKKRG